MKLSKRNKNVKQKEQLEIWFHIEIFGKLLSGNNSDSELAPLT